MATLEQTMMKVQRILTGPMDLRVSVHKDTFGIQFSESSTNVHIPVRQWEPDSDGEPQTLIFINSPILRGVKSTPALFEWVARHGGSRLFGHVEVHDNGQPGLVDLWMSHTLLGDFLDEKELQHGMYAVLAAADGWDDELQKKFGGKRWIDG